MHRARRRTNTSGEFYVFRKFTRRIFLAAPDLALPARYGRVVGLNGSVTVALRDLRLPSARRTGFFANVLSDSAPPRRQKIEEDAAARENSDWHDADKSRSLRRPPVKNGASPLDAEERRDESGDEDETTDDAQDLRGAGG